MKIKLSLPGKVLIQKLITNRPEFRSRTIYQDRYGRSWFKYFNRKVYLNDCEVIG